MIPNWLRRQLEAAGRWNVDGVSRRMSAGHCRTCHAQVVRGLDADVAAITVTADPQPIDQLGEALALLSGRGTWSLLQRDGHWSLSPRDQWRIAAQKPATVLAEHRCGSPPLPAGSPLPAPPPHTADLEEPTW